MRTTAAPYPPTSSSHHPPHFLCEFQNITKHKRTHKIMKPKWDAMSSLLDAIVEKLFKFWDSLNRNSVMHKYVPVWMNACCRCYWWCCSLLHAAVAATTATSAIISVAKLPSRTISQQILLPLCEQCNGKWKSEIHVSLCVWLNGAIVKHECVFSVGIVVCCEFLVADKIYLPLLALFASFIDSLCCSRMLTIWHPLFMDGFWWLPPFTHSLKIQIIKGDNYLACGACIRSTTF